MIRARALLLLALGGCQPLATPVVDTSERDAITALDTRVAGLAQSVAGVEQALTTSTAENKVLAEEVTEHGRALGRVETTLAELPDLLKKVCPPPAASARAAECTSGVQRVPVSGDKLVLGVREHVYVEPPGAALVARIDTALSSNSLYVSDIVEFQRDGDNWVRFNLAVPDEEAPRQIERTLRRRGKGAGDSSGPLYVRLRLSLGDIADSFDFTLVERRSRDYQVRLGRSFLRDMALVDVSREFLQPLPAAQKPAT